ncbi:hypothetical protein GCM10027176_26620 [Actinoallomurus bryophytorum]|uniref:Uncharacterized protein n=1 Tax=Actinoallomurus bryophytorum TaxID=1490222 RepID=A0A543CPR9_9ACTN|nr:hypothetical protein FB559_4749 [Actinoallomurus bryophytorum]
MYKDPDALEGWLANLAKVSLREVARDPSLRPVLKHAVERILEDELGDAQAGFQNRI